MKELSKSGRRDSASWKSDGREKRVRAFYLYEDQLEELEKSESPSRLLRNILSEVFGGAVS